MAKEFKDTLTALDIGTSKVNVAIGQIDENGALTLLGLGSASTQGIKRGVVVNIDATVQSIGQALSEAQFMAQCKVTRVFTGITGAHIRSQNSRGLVAVRSEVTAADVARVIETARAVNIPSDQRLLLVESQEFLIDGHDVREPIGMSGIRLEADIHIVTGAQSAADNLLKCVRRSGLEVENLGLNPTASALATLSADEKELGVAVVDIGAGTTDIAVYSGGALRHTAVIPIAGDLITSDLAMALRTPTKYAEEIKLDAAHAKQINADPNAQIEVPGLGDRQPRLISRQVLAGFVQPRVEEIFTLVQQQLRQSKVEEVLSSGIVLTGGSSIMPGMVELGEDIFLKPVRRAAPNYRGELSELVAQGGASTVMGLLEEARLSRLRGIQGTQKVGGAMGVSLKGFWKGTRRLVTGFF